MITAERARHTINVELVCGIGAGTIAAIIQLFATVMNLQAGCVEMLNLISQALVVGAAVAGISIPFTVGLSFTQPDVRKYSPLLGLAILCMCLINTFIFQADAESCLWLLAYLVVPAIVGRVFAWLWVKLHNQEKQ